MSLGAIELLVPVKFRAKYENGIDPRFNLSFVVSLFEATFGDVCVRKVF
jgi:hypothetical protein